MSTIASPRPSITLSSRRTSVSTDTTTRSASVSRAPAPPSTNQRRNRAALRDYYGIKNSTATEGSTPTSEVQPEDAVDDSALDKPDFNAEQYVKDVLVKEGLEGVLKVEAGLVSGMHWRRTFRAHMKAYSHSCRNPRFRWRAQSACLRQLFEADWSDGHNSQGMFNPYRPRPSHKNIYLFRCARIWTP